MLDRLILIACSEKKLRIAAPAKELYLGRRFRMSLWYAEKQQVPVRILSGKHGLVHPDTLIEPYDYSLRNAPYVQRAVWARGIRDTLEKEGVSNAEITILAPNEYSIPLSIYLNNTHLPFRNLSEEEQVQWLRKSLQ